MNAIKTDDPQAIQKLTLKLQGLEAQREAVKTAKALVKRGAGLDDTELKKNPHYESIMIRSKWTGSVEVPSYISANLSAEIRRVKSRILELETLKNREPQGDQNFGAIVYSENTDLQRVQLFFPGIPSKEIRDELKSYGFKWSRTNEAWQRLLNNQGIHHAKRIAAKYADQV